MSTHKSIRVRRTNVNDPIDSIEFESIHSAMRKCKKSFITIKDLSMNNKIFNGYLWELVKDTNDTAIVERPTMEINEQNHDEKTNLADRVPIIDAYLDELKDIEEYVIEPKDLVIEPLSPISISNSKNKSIFEESKVKNKREPCSCVLM